MYGQENYELAPWMAKCNTQYVHWTQKTEQENEELFAKFKKGLPPKSYVVQSRNSNLTVPKTATVAKKPGQRTRVKTVKSRAKKM